MTIFEAKNYKTREQLENDVRKIAGGDVSPKPDCVIQGTQEELENLQLSDSSVVFGVKTEIIN